MSIKRKKKKEIFAYLVANGNISFVAPAKFKILSGTKNNNEKKIKANTTAILIPTLAIISILNLTEETANCPPYFPIYFHKVIS